MNKNIKRVFLIFITVEFFCWGYFYLVHSFDFQQYIKFYTEYERASYVYDFPIPFKNHEDMANAWSFLKNKISYAGVDQFKSNKMEKIRLEKPEGTFRIFTFGSSSIMGAGIDYIEDTPPGFLELLFERKMNKKVEVVNASIESGFVFDGLLKLMFQIQNYQPDLYVVFIGPEIRFAYDELEAYKKTQHIHQAQFYDQANRLLTDSLLKRTGELYKQAYSTTKNVIQMLFQYPPFLSIRLVQRFVDSITPEFTASNMFKGIVFDPNKTIDVKLALRENLLRQVKMLVKISASLNVPLLVVQEPSPLYLRSDLSVGTKQFQVNNVESLRQGQEIVSFVSRELSQLKQHKHFKYLDLSKLFFDKNGFSSFMHYNVQGSRELANVIYEELKKAGVEKNEISF